MVYDCRVCSKQLMVKASTVYLTWRLLFCCGGVLCGLTFVMLALFLQTLFHSTIFDTMTVCNIYMLTHITGKHFP